MKKNILLIILSIGIGFCGGAIFNSIAANTTRDCTSTSTTLMLSKQQIDDLIRRIDTQNRTFEAGMAHTIRRAIKTELDSTKAFQRNETNAMVQSPLTEAEGLTDSTDNSAVTRSEQAKSLADADSLLEKILASQQITQDEQNTLNTLLSLVSDEEAIRIHRRLGAAVNRGLVTHITP
jgi:hypothetical protein